MCLGVPGQVIALNEQDPLLGTVSVCGIQRDINLACLLGDHNSPQDLLNQWVLVHVGFAMSVIDEHEAQEMLAILAEMGNLETEKHEFSQLGNIS